MASNEWKVLKDAVFDMADSGANHPKLHKLTEIILDHFSIIQNKNNNKIINKNKTHTNFSFWLRTGHADQDTRVMVFSQYRDSVK